MQADLHCDYPRAFNKSLAALVQLCPFSVDLGGLGDVISHSHSFGASDFTAAGTMRLSLT
jgi:ectoine hydroxylase-related dioxygenase (phytanoyl-CoA dioxygenase family)